MGKRVTRQCHCCRKEFDARQVSHVTIKAKVRECASNGSGDYMESEYPPWHLCPDCWRAVDEAMFQRQQEAGNA